LYLSKLRTLLLLPVHELPSIVFSTVHGVVRLELLINTARLQVNCGYTHDFCKVRLTFWTCQSVLVSVPFFLALMTEHQFSLGSCDAGIAIYRDGVVVLIIVMLPFAAV